METDFDLIDQANRAFCGELVVKVPALAPLLEKHLDDEDGDLNTYLFLGAVTEWAEANAVSREADVVQLLAALNQGLAEGKCEVPNFIVVGFLEWLLQNSPLEPLLEGGLKEWHDFHTGVTENHPILRSGH